jgi:hypothetical protein
VKRVFYIREHVEISYELNEVSKQAKAVLSTTVSTDIFRLSSKRVSEIKNQSLEAFENTICFDAISIKESGKKPDDDVFFA